MHWTKRLALSGLAVMMLALLAAVLAPSGYAQDLPPRPPIPTPTPPVPTATSIPEENTRRPKPTAQPLGAITGTVIDLSTGAPSPNIRVYVGGVMVRTDENGNYLRDKLPAGVYTIWLGLDPSTGGTTQTLTSVELAPGGFIVHHLDFEGRGEREEAPQGGS